MTAELYLTDGTTTIDLINLTGNGPFYLNSWRPLIAQFKGGGTFQQSALSDGRRLVDAHYDNVTELLDLKIQEEDPDALALTLIGLRNLLNKGVQYWTTRWQDEPVYLVARAECETNLRYALLVTWSMPEDENPYAQPFLNPDGTVANDITLQIERTHWLDAAPDANGSTITATAQQDWAYDAKWVNYSSFGALPNLPSGERYGAIVTVGDDTIILSAPSFLGGSDKIYYSNDGGTTWTAAAGDVADVVEFLKITDNYILGSAQTPRVVLSTDGGQNWSSISTTAGGTRILKLSSGALVAGKYLDSQIYRSSNNGNSWVEIHDFQTPSYNAILRTITLSPVTGTLIAVTQDFAAATRNDVWRSTDNGESWSLVYFFDISLPDSRNTSACDLDGNFIIVTPLWSSGEWIRSIDDGLTWATASGVTRPSLVFVDSEGKVYFVTGTASPAVYESIDNGVNFTNVHSIGGTVTPWDMKESDDGNLYITAYVAGDRDFVFTIDDYSVNLGGTSSDRIYISNKRNDANITDIYVDDGGVFGSNRFPVTAAFDLYPAVPVANDAVYFGIDTSIDNSGPFSSLVFDISQVQVGITVTWEYWDGAAWSTLTVQDNTANLQAFDTPGINSVHWEYPSDWDTTAVNGVTGYWVRARVTAVSSPGPPEQNNTNIYSIVTPFIEVAEDTIKGNLPALIRNMIKNQSDKDGPAGSSPNLYSNRLLVGLRSMSRGQNFTAYLNAADEQNPTGVTVSAGTNTSIVDNLSSATGRAARYNPAALEAMATRLTFALATTIARDFYGTFRLFLRGRQDNGTEGDIEVQAQVTTGSGGVTKTGESVAFDNVNDDQILDLGAITLPVTSELKQTELADETSIVIQASASSGTPDLYIYDLVLIPTDEWAADILDTVNDADSALEGQHSLDIDSATFQKKVIRTLILDESDLITSSYRGVANGPAILQHHTQQRLWFLSTRYVSAGSSDERSEHEVAFSGSITGKQRYLSYRGDQ